jgi:hypothetical protein
MGKEELSYRRCYSIDEPPFGWSVFFAVWCSICRQVAVVVGCAGLVCLLIQRLHALEVISFCFVVTVFVRFFIN